MLLRIRERIECGMSTYLKYVKPFSVISECCRWELKGLIQEGVRKRRSTWTYKTYSHQEARAIVFWLCGMDKGFENAYYSRGGQMIFDKDAQAVFRLNLGELMEEI